VYILYRNYILKHLLYLLRKCVVSGRRIVDIQHIFNTIAKISHHPFHCSFLNLRLVKEIQHGFLSDFCFICEICRKEEIIRSEPFTDELIPINLAIVT